MSDTGCPSCYLATRHGENSGHFFNSVIAHSVDLSVWQLLHEFGIFSESVNTGEMNLNVWLRTLMSAIVCSIFGMWHPTHWLPSLAAA